MTAQLDDGTSAPVLYLTGDVDFFSEDAFRAEAEQLLTDDAAGFVVDFSAVATIDSSGLSLLIDLLRLCREMGLPMLLRGVPARVQQLFELTGLDEVMAADESGLKDRGAR